MTHPLVRLLAILACMLAPLALASIGEAPDTIVQAVASYQPEAVEDGWQAGAGFHFSIDEAEGLALAVHGEGSLVDANVRFVSDLIGAASGYGDGIAGPAAEFFRTRAGDLSGQGEAAIGVEEYVLRLSVTGDAPYTLTFTLEPQRVADGDFPPASHTLGPADAKHVIREFSDFQCPFCARFVAQVFPTIEQELLAGGDVRFEFHHFPLKTIHPNAVAGAEAAECVTAANDPEAFWTYHDALFANQDAWTSLSDPTDALVTLASDAGLSTDGVAQCIRDGTYSDEIEQAYQAAGSVLHLTGTPTLFVDDLKVGNYSDITAYRRLMALSDALRSAATGTSGGAGN